MSGAPHIARSLGTVDAIRGLADQGMGGKASARHLGMASSWVYTLAARHDIDVRKGKPVTMRSIREQIQDMRPIDALEHILFVLEEMLGSDDDLIGIVHRLACKPAEARLYLALDRVAPKALSRDQLLTIASRDSMNPPGMGVLDVQLHRLRQKLPPREQIVTVWGYGYRLERKTDI